MTTDPLDVVPRLFRLELPRDHESVERALLLAICLAIQVDQKVTPEEVADGVKLMEQFYSHAYADGEELRGVLTAALAKVRVDGPVKTIDLLTNLLHTDEDRELALKVVAFISDSDQRVVPIEGALLQSLGQAFGFDNDRMAEIFDDLDEHVARTRAEDEAINQPQTPENNPFLAYTKPPEYMACKPWQLEPAVDTLLPQVMEHFKEIEDHAAPTWSKLIEPLEALDERLGFTWSLASHLLSVKNSDELRLAYDAVLPKLVAANTQMGQSAKIYDKLLELQDSDALDEGQRRIVDNLVHAAKLGGVGLEGLKKTRFNEIQEQLASLSTLFGNNVLDGTKSFEMILTKPEETQGLEKSDLQLAAQSARSAGHKDATAAEGPWRITLDFPSMGPFLKHSARRDLRQHLYMAYITRASFGEEDNTPVIDQILKLRQERSALLGFENYAEQSLSSKMADQAQSVYGLIQTLRDASWHRAQDELKELRAFAKARGATEELKPWDIAYWAEQLRRDQYQYSSEEVRQYFQFPKVLGALFSLVEQLFGVRVEHADGQAPVWHEDVQFFNVFEGQTHIASFYLDPYSRPQEKRGGAWHNKMQGRSGPLAPAGKAFRVPVSILVCNQTPPVDGRPSLMTFNEVTTLFHEFGHGLQHMLTRVDYGMAAGISNVEWDAVELPSQFMENWCYQPEVIAQMTAHVDTGEPLPEELREKIIASKNFRAASDMLRQLYFGSLDMALHDRYNPEEDGASPFQIQKEIAAQMNPMPLLPEDRFLCSFSHIFAGGYAAGYYSYKWAEVLSADAFSAFEEAGLDDKKALATTGKRFRDTVLAMGGSKHPMTVFKDFRGREPQTDALLRHNDLA